MTAQTISNEITFQPFNEHSRGAASLLPHVYTCIVARSGYYCLPRPSEGKFGAIAMQNVNADPVCPPYPDTLTLLPTYRCTAACAQCCFESSPTVTGRLSLETILRRIDEAARAFPNLRLVVFSGGECFLLKDDLMVAIRHVRSLGIDCRCVTNGFWGKTAHGAERVVAQLCSSGLSEINLSTGLDHQRFVPFQSIVNCVSELVRKGIRTVVTVEADTNESLCYAEARNHPLFRQYLTERPAQFFLMCNSWMPFHGDAQTRSHRARIQADMPCRQLFHNIVITPHDNLSACCGLTHEHIPELHLGKIADGTLKHLFDQQYEDFLKIWIHVDGPSKIIERLFGDEGRESLKNVVHICQSCAILHQHPAIRHRLRERYLEFVPEVMARFELQKALHTREWAAERTKLVTQRKRLVLG